MSSNTLTEEEFDKIIDEITNDSSADDTKLLYNRPDIKDNISKINVTFSVQRYSKKTIYGINVKLFTELLGRLAACKNDGKNNECESLEAKSDFFTIVKKQANRAAKGESRHKTISYKDEIRNLINEINSYNNGDLSNPLMLEQLFIKHFDKEKYDEYINVYRFNKQNYIKQTNCNMMTTSNKTRNAINYIFNVLNEMNAEELTYISSNFQNKLKNTTNMDQLLKFFKIFNNSAQLYQRVACDMNGGKRRKTKLKKRRKKRKSQKKRKLKS